MLQYIILSIHLFTVRKLESKIVEETMYRNNTNEIWQMVDVVT